ncbi:hypothetical protein IF2G_06175 [Cordyceps javanica]|nr:hypothetical protein IF2G_06175 [Cordyceps javanica]
MVQQETNRKRPVHKEIFVPAFYTLPAAFTADLTFSQRNPESKIALKMQRTEVEEKRKGSKSDRLQNPKVEEGGPKVDMQANGPICEASVRQKERRKAANQWRRDREAIKL